MPDFASTVKVFNTAILATKARRDTECSRRLTEIVNSKTFQAMMTAVQNYAEQTGLNEEQAAEEFIKTFRSLDKIWDDFLIQEGLEKIRGNSH